jgi:hypothetical protein
METLPLPCFTAVTKVGSQAERVLPERAASFRLAHNLQRARLGVGIAGNGND